MMVAGFYFHPAEKSSFFGFYVNGVTLADGGEKPPLCKGRWILPQAKDGGIGNYQHVTTPPAKIGDFRQLPLHRGAFALRADVGIRPYEWIFCVFPFFVSVSEKKHLYFILTWQSYVCGKKNAFFGKY